MLGMYVTPPLWMARIAQGRGACVCTEGLLTDVPDAVHGAPPSFHCVLQAEGDTYIPLTITGRHALALHQALQRQHPANEPIPVFLSGYGAEIVRIPSSDTPRAGVVWSDRIALKAQVDVNDADTMQLWFEGDRASPAQVVLQRIDEPRTLTMDSDAWYATHPTYTSDTPLDPPASASMPPMAPPPSDAAHPWLTPSTWDGHLYTPIHALRAGTTANVVGIVVDVPLQHAPKRRANGTMSDAMLRLSLRQPYTEAGVPSLLPGNVFARTSEQLPLHVSAGDAMLLRGIQIHMYNERANLVGPAFVPWSWATMSATSRALAHSSEGPRVGEQERAVLDRLLQTHQTPRSSKRPLSTLDQLEQDTFVDLIVQIVNVYVKGTVPDVYVADFTSNSAFYGNDARLARQYSLPQPLQHFGYVFQVGLWGQQAPLALRLQPGQLVRMDNVRVKRTASGFLHGSIGHQNDPGYDIHILTDKDPSVQALLQRRTQWLQKVTSTPAATPPPPVVRGEKRTASSSPPWAERDVKPSPAASPGRDVQALPPASLLPPSPPPPVHAPRYRLDSDDSESTFAYVWNE